MKKSPGSNSFFPLLGWSFWAEAHTDDTPSHGRSDLPSNESFFFYAQAETVNEMFFYDVQNQFWQKQLLTYGQKHYSLYY